MNPTNIASSWAERAAILKRTRTCFLDKASNMPIPASESALHNNLWYTIRMYKEDERFTDEQLVNITIQRLREKRFTVEDKPELQHRGWHISYPIADLANADHLELAMGMARSRREEIAKGEVSLDRIMIFSKLIPEPQTQIQGLRAMK